MSHLGLGEGGYVCLNRPRSSAVTFGGKAEVRTRARNDLNDPQCHLENVRGFGMTNVATDLLPIDLERAAEHAGKTNEPR